MKDCRALVPVVESSQELAKLWFGVLCVDCACGAASGGRGTAPCSVCTYLA